MKSPLLGMLNSLREVTKHLEYVICLIFHPPHTVYRKTLGKSLTIFPFIPETRDGII